MWCGGGPDISPGTPVGRLDGPRKIRLLVVYGSGFYKYIGV